MTDEYEKLRKLYRQKVPKHVLVVELVPVNYENYFYVFKTSNYIRNLSNFLKITFNI